MSAGTAVLSFSGVVLMLAGLAPPGQRGEAPPHGLSAEEVLERTKTLYPTLKSYADSGTVTYETSGITDRSSFRTSYVNQPRNFLFDYREIESEYKSGFKLPMNNRLVLWMLHGQLQAWQAGPGIHEEFPEGSNQVRPFVGAAIGTNGVATLIPSLIYVKANLVTTIQELGDVTSAGVETLRGRRCHKLMGIARSVYPSGQITNVRPATVWIDTETFLIRQVFTDTPKGYPAGQISRLTIAYEPQLNPRLHDSLFTFTVPSAQQ